MEMTSPVVMTTPVNDASVGRELTMSESDIGLGQLSTSDVDVCCNTQEAQLSLTYNNASSATQLILHRQVISKVFPDSDCQI